MTRKWTLGAEVTYKKVAIDADARIDNQRFHDDKNNIISRFCGSAEMSMDFTMLEIPLYFKYTFKNQKDRILAGLYGAWIIDAKFRNTVTKGYMMTEYTMVLSIRAILYILISAIYWIVGIWVLLLDTNVNYFHA